jgi:hypothetical protein
MALTSLIINLPEGNKYLQVETIEGDNGVIVHWYSCDSEFNPDGAKDASADRRTEEQFHRELRVESAKRGQLITSHSTNPEWNPEDYIRNYDPKSTEDGSNANI